MRRRRRGVSNVWHSVALGRPPCRGAAQLRKLGFEHRDALIALGQCGSDILCLETLGDVLRTIHIPGRHGYQDRPFGASLVVFRLQSCRQFGVIFDNSSLTPNLDSITRRVIDQEQMNLGVVGEIPQGDVLAVTGKVGKPKGAFVKYSKKSGGPAAMLDVGLPRAVGSSEKNTRLRLDEGFQIGRDDRLPGPPCSMRS